MMSEESMTGKQLINLPSSTLSFDNTLLLFGVVILVVTFIALIRLIR